MFKSLQAPSADPLFAVNALFRNDKSPGKLDLCVGVYKDENGRTPTMKAVRDAEIAIAHRSESKAYVSLAGNAGFNTAIGDLALGGPFRSEDRAVLQTVAGTGALRVLFELVAATKPDSTVWISDPGYANHEPLVRAVGLRVARYRYLDSSGQVDSTAVIHGLRKVRRGDVILLHASCHNPSGADMPLELWKSVAEILRDTGAVPLIDAAYLGLGDGLAADAAGLRYMARHLETVMVSISCSKTFGLYRDRVGAAMVLGPRPSVMQAVLEQLTRSLYSMPPNHGAGIVAEILGSRELTACWEEELARMRQRITVIRTHLAAALAAVTQSDWYNSIEQQKGLFSMLPLTTAQMTQLRSDHAIYGAPDGRINIAGLNTSQIPRLAEHIRQVTQC